jgi:branched-chain amino acid aminotransferase
VLNLIAINKLDACYVRPVVYRGYDSLGVDPRKCPVDVAIAVWPWGDYLGKKAAEEGASVCVSSWHRPAANTLPMMAKAGANYMNSQLIKVEAMDRGYDEGIALDVHGMVSEGSGENIFIVKRGSLVTPSFESSILPGITRRTVIRLASDMGIKVIEEPMPREALYIADEVFFTGSAAEITPITKIDDIEVGDGKPGEITIRLRDRFQQIVHGEIEDTHGWLTFVPELKTVQV